MLTWKSILIIGAALLLIVVVIFMKTNTLDTSKEKVTTFKSEKKLQNSKNLADLKNKIKSTVQESIDEEIQKEVQKEIEQSNNK
jgi:uncharacterized protein YpmS